MKKVIFLFFLFNLILINFVIADEKKKYEDCNLNFKNSWIVRPVIQLSAVALRIDDFTTDSEYEYVPNVNFNTGARVSYLGIEILFKTKIKGTSFSEEEFGKTDYFDFQFSFYKQKFGVDFIYQNYKGFYLNEPGEYGFSRGDVNSLRPDIELTTVGFNGFYVFSDTFSFSAAYKLFERQKKSQGSFLLMASFNYHYLKSDRSLLPTPINGENGTLIDYRGGEYISIGMAPGYAYSYIYKNYFITPGLFLGGGIMDKVDEIEKKNKERFQPFLKANARLSLGFNGNRYVYGFTIFGDNVFSHSFSSKIPSINIFSGYAEFFAGIRF